MAGQRGFFDPHGPIEQDRRLAKVLQANETVTSAGAGAILVPMMKPQRGKVYITSVRLAVVPDDPRFTPVWSELWQDIASVRVKKGFMGSTAFVTSLTGELGVDSTKAMVADIERAWAHMHATPRPKDSTFVDYLPSVDVRCGGCGSQVRPGSPRCGMCLRNVKWRDPIDTLSEAIVTPDAFMPEHFPDGTSTQRSAIVPGLATLVATAECLGEFDFTSRATSLIDHIKERQSAPADTFGDLPIMRGAGDQESNEKFWAMCCKLPERLSR